MIKEFILDKGTFLLQQSVKDWKEVVKKCVDLLVNAGVATHSYYEGILKMVEDYGPYFVIAPGIAMPHARPEMGALNTGFALITLKEPVIFGHKDNDPVSIVLCICAKDSKDMNETAIIDAMSLIDEDEFIEELKSAKTKNDLAIVLAKAQAAYDY